MTSSVRFSLIITAVFILLGYVVVSHHEMWRDEIHLFQLARNSPTLGSLLVQNVPDNQPVVWPLMVYWLNCAANDPLSMQFLTLMISACAVYLFTRCSNFSKLQKILFPFGYIIFYEYTVIARRYAIGVLLVFIFCCLFPNRHKRFIAISIVLFLLANTHGIACVVAAGIGASLVLEYIFGWGNIRASISKKKFMWGTYIIFIGCVLSFVQCTDQLYDPAHPHKLHTSFSLTDPILIEALSSVAYGVFALPEMGVHFIDTSALNVFPPSVRVGATLAIISFMCLVLMRYPVLLCVYILPTVGMVVFYHLYEGASMRHYGQHYIVLIAALWLCYTQETWHVEPASRVTRRAHVWIKSAASIFLCVILITQLCGSLYPSYAEIKYPFSTGQMVAQWIKDSGMEGWMIVGHPHENISAIVGYLDTDFLALDFDKFLSYPDLPIDGMWGGRIPLESIIWKLPALREKHGTKILFIFNRPLDESLRVRYGLVESARFTGAIIADEDFYVYTFREALPPQEK